MTFILMIYFNSKSDAFEKLALNLDRYELMQPLMLANKVEERLKIARGKKDKTEITIKGAQFQLQFDGHDPQLTGDLRQILPQPRKPLIKYSWQDWKRLLKEETSWEKITVLIIACTNIAYHGVKIKHHINSDVSGLSKTVFILKELYDVQSIWVSFNLTELLFLGGKRIIHYVKGNQDDE